MKVSSKEYKSKIAGSCSHWTLQGEENLSDLIHHSDRGIQYCCDQYVTLLQMHNITISMTEDYKPTDNAIAERVNGTIRTELIYRKSYPNSG